MSTTLKTIIGALISDALALAVSFGVTISVSQQTALLAFVGSTTTAIAALVAWHDSHKLAAKALVATGPTSTSTAPTVASAAQQVTNA